MGFAGSLVAVLGGLLAALPAVGAANAKLKGSLEKLAPVQGYLGVLLLLWGVWGVVYSALHLNLFGHAPVFMALFLAGAVACAGVGFLLGYGLVVRHGVGNNAGARAKAEALHAKLVAVQVPLGLTAAALGVAGLLAGLLL